MTLTITKLNSYLPKTSPLLILLSSILISLSTGTLFIYSIYVPQLAQACNLTTSQTSNLSFAVTIGTAVGGFLSGFLTDMKGTQLPILIGGVCISMGYGIVHWIYTNAINGNIYNGVILYLMIAMVLIGIGSVSAYFATIKAVTLAFPNYKGSAQSIPISSFAMAAFIFSICSSKLFHGNIAGFLRFLSISCGLGCLVGSIYVRDLNYSQSNIAKLGDDQDGRNLLTFDHNSQSEYTLYGSDTEISQPPESELELDAPSIKESLCSPLFLSHYITLGLIQGIGQMYIYSIGFIILAQLNNRPDEHDKLDVHDLQAIHVSIISITSFLGRIISGPQSDLIIKKYNLKRIWNLLLGIFLLTVGQFMVSVTDDIRLRLCFVSGIIGYSYGFLFGTYPSIISDSFHMSQFSSIWGCLCTCSVITTSTMTRIFGVIYEKNSIVGDGGQLICVKGLSCYRETFVISEFIGVFLFLFVLVMIYLQRET